MVDGTPVGRAEECSGSRGRKQGGRAVVRTRVLVITNNEQTEWRAVLGGDEPWERKRNGGTSGRAWAMTRQRDD